MATISEPILTASLDLLGYYNEILKMKCSATPWGLFGYEDEQNPNNLVLIEEGTTWNDMIAQLQEDRLLFGFVKISDGKQNNQKGKLVLISWQGSSVEYDLKVKSQQHFTENIKTMFSKHDLFIQCDNTEYLNSMLKFILSEKSKNRESIMQEAVSDSSLNLAGKRIKNKFRPMSMRKINLNRSVKILDGVKLNDVTTSKHESYVDEEKPPEDSPIKMPIQETKDSDPSQSTQNSTTDKLESLINQPSINFADLKKVKLIIIGDAAVGKTHILHTYVFGIKQKFEPKATIGVDYLYRIIRTDTQQNLKLEMWDTSGEEKYRSLASVWYRHANAALLVFDITSSVSFNSIPNWLESVKRYADCSLWVLVGNKSDLEEQRQVTKEEAQKYAKKNDMIYVETSAKIGLKVDEMFLQLSNELVKERKTPENTDASQPTVTLANNFYSTNKLDDNRVSLEINPKQKHSKKMACCK